MTAARHTDVPPCGFPLPQGMTAAWHADVPALWILDQAQYDDAVHRFHPLVPVSSTGTVISFLSRQETFAKPTVIPCGSGNLWKTQLGRLRIWTRYPCSTEFCKDLIKGEGTTLGTVILTLRQNLGDGRFHHSRLVVSDKVALLR